MSIDPEGVDANPAEETSEIGGPSLEFINLVELAWSQLSLRSSSARQNDDSRGTPSSDPSSGDLARLKPAPTIGRFQIEGELGRGGGGIVFLALDPNLGRRVALKVPGPGVLLSPTERERFFREGRAAAALRHPNIVTVYEANEAGRIPYLSMEYCEAGSLESWLGSRDPDPPIDPRDAAWIVLGLAQGVHHAHGQGVVHRDLKPGNILLQAREDDEPGLGFVPKVSDFGLARYDDAVSSNLTRTEEGRPLGTLSYMSPEAARGDRGAIGPATDVYGLGVILFELLTGCPPFRASTRGELIHQILEARPPSVRRFRDDAPPALDAICAHCLEKDAAQRYESPNDLVTDLRRYLDNQPVLATAGPTLGRGHPRFVIPRGARRVVLGGVVLAGLGVVASRARWKEPALDKPAIPANVVTPKRGTIDFERLLDAGPEDLRALATLDPGSTDESRGRLRAILSSGADQAGASASRRANAACALLALGGDEPEAWALLRFQPNPEARSYLIHRLAKVGVDPERLLTRLDHETDVGIRRALLLALGEYPTETSTARLVLARAFVIYRTDPDPGVHGAAKWLIIHRGRRADLREIDAEIAAAPVPPRRRWRISPAGLTFVRLRDTLTDREFEITDAEVTVAQFLKFRPDHRHVLEESPDSDGPINEINAAIAADYCEWLGRLEKTTPDGGGYRLPTVAEFERACRADTTTLRYFGDRDDLLPAYAWFGQPLEIVLRPSCELKPNDFGLFDMMGNADEVCRNLTDLVPSNRSRVCGGSILYDASSLRSDLKRGPIPLTETGPMTHAFGFRVARTIPIAGR